MLFSPSKFVVQTYTNSLSLPALVWDFFATHQKHTNVIYPVAKKCLQLELSGDSPPPGTLWMTCFTTYSSQDPSLDFVLSCTPGPQGLYPIFICSTKAPQRLSDDYIQPRLKELVRGLHASVPTARVYSVFAPKSIAKCFVHLWTAQTGISLSEDPVYYSAKLTHCSRASFCNRRPTQNSDCSYIMRPAVEADISSAASLCYGFAAVSVS
jgi:hypothetical protein